MPISRVTRRAKAHRARPGVAGQDRAAAEVFHRHVVVVADAADIVDADDVTMVQARGDARLAQEALAEIRIGQQRRRHDLERNFALHRFLQRQVNGRHAAAAELAQDAVSGYFDHVCLPRCRRANKSGIADRGSALLVA